MHGQHHHRRGFRRPPFGRRWYSSENVLERLESYQRDLEQELADVSDLIKRLRETEAAPSAPDQTATVGSLLISPGHVPGHGPGTWPVRRLERRSGRRKRRPSGQALASSSSFFVSEMTFCAMCAGTSS
jgi:hypothetical protein